jgi:hypothetical protein
VTKESRRLRAKRKAKMMELNRKGVPCPESKFKRKAPLKIKVRPATESTPGLWIVNKPVNEEA